MRLSLIVAMAENRVIGRAGGLPWRIPGELKYFKQKTMGKPIVMGRKTWESLGRPLPGRGNIVITRSRDYEAEGAHVTHSLDQAVAVARGLIENPDSPLAEVMIIGGAEIYRLALPLATRIYLTEVMAKPQGDARLTEFEGPAWRQSYLREVPAEGDTPAYNLTILERHPVSS